MARRRKRNEATPTGRPVIATATDVDVDAFTVMPDGRRMERHVFALTEEQVGRIKAGYTCVKCLEDYASPFPDACSVCGFPMREQQAAEFAKDFRGNIRFGPSTTLEEEYAIAEEMIQREAYEKATRLGLILPKPSIIVPRSA
jgi:hypothetical protein